MKNFIGILSLLIVMTTVSCKTNVEKEEPITEEEAQVEADLEIANKDLNKSIVSKANDAEWQLYKQEANITIAENESRIKELKVAIKKTGTTFDENYEKNIESLQQKNNDLKTKITNYENNQTDWDAFKREFDSDLQGFSNAFKNLTVNNKK